MNRPVHVWANTWLPALLVVAVLISPALSAVNSSAHDIESFRGELSRFFINLNDYAPTAMGSLDASPEAQQAIQTRIQALTPAELAAIQNVFSRVPKWQMVPELLATVVPNDLRNGIKDIREFSAERVAELKQFRFEIQRINTLLLLLPDAKLKELGQTRQKIRAAQAVYRGYGPAQLTAVRAHMEGKYQWKEIVDDLERTLSPEVLSAVDRLAKRGGLSPTDISELERFQSDLVVFFASLMLVPDQGIEVEVADRAIVTLSGLQPEMLFLVREKLASNPQWSKIPEVVDANFSETDRQHLQVLAKSRPFTEKRQKELESFRSDFSRFYSEMALVEGNMDSLAQAQADLERFGPAELALMEAQANAIPGWRSLPTYVSLLQDFSRQTDLPEVSTEQVEAFRGQIMGEVAHLQDQGLITAEARKLVQEFPAEQLKTFQQMYSQTPAERAEPMRELLTAIIANPAAPQAAIGDCFSGNTIDVCPKVVFVPAIPQACTDVCGDPCAILTLGFESCYGCESVCTPATPELSLDPSCPITLPGPNVTCLGNEIASAGTSLTNQFTGPINDLSSSVASLIQDATNAVNALGSGLSGIANGVAGTATQIANTVGGFATQLANQIDSVTSQVTSQITGAVGSITGFVANIPGAFQGFFTDIVNAALEPLGLDITNISPQGFAAKLAEGLESLVDNMPILPDLPCPPAGTVIPLLGGEVGDGEAAAKMDDMVWVLQTVSDVIPETEWTLPFLVPYNISILAVDYLNLCMQNAADRADNADLEEFREAVAEALEAQAEQLDDTTSNVSDQIDLTRTNLAALIADVTNGLNERNATAKVNLTSRVSLAETNLTNLVDSTEVDLALTVNATSDALEASITSTTSTLTNAISDATDELTASINRFQGAATQGFDDQHALLDNQVQDQTDLMVQLWIEKQLLEDHGAQALALFQLPESVGGFLDSVRSAVYQALDLATASGHEVKAKTYKDLDKAEELYAQGDFKAAYEGYAGVYRNLTK